MCVCVYERAFDGQEMDKRCLMLFMQKYDTHNSQSERERDTQRDRERERVCVCVSDPKSGCEWESVR